MMFQALNVVLWIVYIYYMRLVKMLIGLLCCCLAPSLVAGQGRSIDMARDKGDLIEDLLFEFYDNDDFNGSVLVADNDLIVYENTFGYADFDSRLPLDSETPFYLASLGKQFTATAIMLLVERGKINLNDPLRLYLPALPEIYTGVKIEHLLNHTSGIPDYLNSGWLFPGVTNNQVFTFLTEQQSLDFTPGSKFRYSNSGYVLLAQIIESVAGKAISNFFYEEFFYPLNMNNTFVFEEKTGDRYRAKGFSEKGKPEDYNLLTVGDGGVYSTASDLFLWLKALNDERIVSSYSLEQMYAPVKLPGGREKRYGYGWELGNNFAGPFVYHSGQLAGFRTYFEYQKSKKMTIIILANKSFDSMSGLRNQLVKILDGRLTGNRDF